MVKLIKSHKGSYPAANVLCTRPPFPPFPTTFENVRCQPVTLLCLVDTAGAGDLVRTTANLQEVHLDNSTCSWRIGSQYLYLTPPEISVVNETGNPVPLMGEYFVLVKLAFDDPQQHLSESTIEVSPAFSSSIHLFIY